MNEYPFHPIHSIKIVTGSTNQSITVTNKQLFVTNMKI